MIKLATDNKKFTEYDLLLIEAMKQHTLMLCVKVSASGMTRKYKVLTIFEGRIVDCNYTLKKAGYKVGKDDLVSIQGCGFSPLPDLAYDLGVEQSKLQEFYA